jgi:hypothetical protein
MPSRVGLPARNPSTSTRRTIYASPFGEKDTRMLKTTGDVAADGASVAQPDAHEMEMARLRTMLRQRMSPEMAEKQLRRWSRALENHGASRIGEGR